MPSIILSPNSGPVGTAFSVSGTGFEPTDMVYFTTVQQGQFSKQIVQMDGTVQTLNQVPTGITNPYIVTATAGLTGEAVTAQFTITGGNVLSMSLTPASGGWRTMVLVKGDGFQPNEYLRIMWQGGVAANWRADASGHFEIGGVECPPPWASQNALSEGPGYYIVGLQSFAVPYSGPPEVTAQFYFDGTGERYTQPPPPAPPIVPPSPTSRLPLVTALLLTALGAGLVIKATLSAE